MNFAFLCGYYFVYFVTFVVKYKVMMLTFEECVKLGADFLTIGLTCEKRSIGADYYAPDASSAAEVSIQANTSLENIETFYEAAREFGGY